MPPKVLFTASTYSHLRHFHLPYLDWFQRQGWIVHTACGGAPAPIPFSDEVIDLPLEKRMTAPGNLRAAALLRRKIQAEGYDLLCTHTSLAAFFSRIAVLGLDRRPAVVNMVHGYLFDGDTPRLKREVLLAAERLTAPVTDLLLTMNRWDDEAARRYRLGRRVARIPGIGVDFSDYASPLSKTELREEFCVPPDAFVLIYPAEFSKRKSQGVLLHALALLPREVTLLLPGDGAELAACRALARELGVADRVIFPGYLTDMAPWYALSDAAVSASRSEGLPFNVMEAMYAGLPVAASAVKGHTDLIEDGRTGLLYPYGDAEGCAEQVRRLMASQELRRELGQRARESVAQYSLHTVLPQVTAEYESVVQVAHTFLL